MVSLDKGCFRYCVTDSNDLYFYTWIHILFYRKMTTFIGGLFFVHYPQIIPKTNYLKLFLAYRQVYLLSDITISINRLGDDKMFYFNKRLGELFLEGKNRSLTIEEQTEMCHCLEMNMNMMIRIENLKSLSLLASDTEDYEWLHQITAELDKLYEKSLLS